MILPQTEITAWLTLAHTPSIGIRTIQKALEFFSSAEDIIHADHMTLSQYFSASQIYALKKSQQKYISCALNWLDQSSLNHIIPYVDQRYPSLLREISCPPPLLYVCGNPKTLLEPQIAIIGSRNPTHSGLEHAKTFATDLSTLGLCITSGMALGIDGAAHEGALNAGGKTIAVLGTGLSYLYPKRHTHLASEITRHGCLVSELLLNTRPIPTNFPRRNRIISGLSVGTLVIEATPKSGSLITARYALEQNREVFALPGSLRNPNALGCLKLIQEGAKCITNTEDILSEINVLPNNPSKTPPLPNTKNLAIAVGITLTNEETIILNCIDNDSTATVDQICERSKLPAQSVLTTLLHLELKDLVSAQQGGYTKI